MRKLDTVILILFSFFIVGIITQYDLLPSFIFPISNAYQTAISWMPQKESIDKAKDKLITKNEETIIPEISLLGRAEVSYLGGTLNRNINIELGISRINGTVVHPGEEFSFNKTLGKVLSIDGFKEAKSFLNGEIIQGIGGGLCHVSSTLFQSILNAGLPVTERHNHTFTVPFYQVGLDATIAENGPDLKFVNDTGFDITIKGYTENKNAIFELYGVKDGRIAKVSEAEVFDITDFLPTKYISVYSLPIGQKICEHSAQKGYSAKRMYTIFYKNGENKEQEFFSIYSPLQKICQIGINGSTDTTGCTIETVYSPLTGAKCDSVNI